MSTETLFVFLLLFLLIILIAGIALLAFLYFSLKTNVSYKIQEAVTNWQAKELDKIRLEQKEIAQKEALDQLQHWREQELDISRKQQLETARSEASVQFEQWKNEYTESIRQDAIQKSQAVTVGKITEHIIPYLPDFKYNPKDARFLGSPIDFIVFDGLDEGEIKRIVLMEIKTGASNLTTRERQIRDAINAGKLEWVELRRPEIVITEPVNHGSSVEVSSTNINELPAPGSNEGDVQKRVRSILEK